MSRVSTTAKLLGVAFLLQFITSFVSSAIILPQVTGESPMSASPTISEILVNVANHAGLMKVHILGEVFTALGVIFLGAMLYIVLRKQDERLALTALGFYILEGVLLAASRMGAYSLLQIGQEFMAAGQPESLLALGKIANEVTGYAYSMANIGFALGAPLFYYLLDKSRIVPRGLSLWGLIATIPFVFGIPATLLGVEVPFILYLAYVPYELVMGLWFLFKGFKPGSYQEN